MEPSSSSSHPSHVDGYSYGPSDLVKGATRKEKRFVPWEPFKAAPSKHTKSSGPPTSLPPLIPYRNEVNNNVKVVEHEAARVEEEEEEERRVESGHVVEASWLAERDAVEAERDRLERELRAERQANAELKRLVVAAMQDDLGEHVAALANDRVQLARHLDTAASQIVDDNEEADQLRIEVDVWRCKYSAMSVRCDEMTRRAEALLAQLRYGQQLVRQIDHRQVPHSVAVDVARFATLDLSPIWRSPCEETVGRKAPLSRNITVSCCRNCSGKEIILL